MKKEVLRCIGVCVEDYKLGGLADATFSLYAGETVALAGLNNSGKKTLLSLLQGKRPQYKGQVYVNGTPVVLRNLIDVYHAGITTIGESTLVFDNMSIDDNVIIMERGKRLFSLFKKQLSNKNANVLYEALGIDSLVKAGKLLTVFEKKKIEIVKTYLGGAHIMLFTDIAVYCGEKEAKELDGIIGLLNSMGISVVIEYDAFFKYFEKRVMRCIVLRRGMLTTTLYQKAEAFDTDEINYVMMGCVFDRQSPKPNTFTAERAHSAKLDIVHRDTGRTFQLYGGAIVGVYDEKERIPRSLEVFIPASAAKFQVSLNDQNVGCRNIHELVKHRVAVIARGTSDMLVFPNLSPVENVGMLAGQIFGRSVVYNKDMDNYLFDMVLGKYPILKHLSKLRDDKNCLALSLQQLYDIILAKWLAINPNIVIMFAPFGNHDAINVERYKELQNTIAEKGKIVMVISSNLDDLFPYLPSVYPAIW